MISINAEIDEDQREKPTDDCVPVIRVTGSLGGRSVPADEFVERSDFLFAGAQASNAVAYIYRAFVAKRFVAVFADRDRVDALVIETLHKVDSNLGPIGHIGPIVPNVYVTSARAIRRLSLS